MSVVSTPGWFLESTCGQMTLGAARKEDMWMTREGCGRPVRGEALG
jgi:hypothetical protein